MAAHAATIWEDVHIPSLQTVSAPVQSSLLEQGIAMQLQVASLNVYPAMHAMGVSGQPVLLLVLAPRLVLALLWPPLWPLLVELVLLPPLLHAASIAPARATTRTGRERLDAIRIEPR
jgi:hypothetical protein